MAYNVCVHCVVNCYVSIHVSRHKSPGVGGFDVFSFVSISKCLKANLSRSCGGGDVA